MAVDFYLFYGNVLQLSTVRASGRWSLFCIPHMCLSAGVTVFNKPNMKLFKTQATEKYTYILLCSHTTIIIFFLTFRMTLHYPSDQHFCVVVSLAFAVLLLIIIIKHSPSRNDSHLRLISSHIVCLFIVYSTSGT